jgi:glutaconate CoA-transferase subunit B
MTIAAAREITDTDIIFCGTGLPIVVARTAKHIHAPGSIIFFETGAIDSPLLDLPMFVADSRVMAGAVFHTGLVDAISMLQNNKIGPRTVTILGAAQIDRFGNLNSTCIGDYLEPKARFSGSGGAADSACMSGRMIIFMKHEKRRFVERLDYLTSPGWLKGSRSREQRGLTRGGASVLITDKCIIRFHPEHKTMYLSEYFPGSEPKKIEQNTGFQLDLSLAREMSPPTSEELRVLREEIDPDRLIIF